MCIKKWASFFKRSKQQDKEARQEQTQREATLFPALFHSLSEGVAVFEQTGAIWKKNRAADALLLAENNITSFQSLCEQLQLNTSLEEFLLLPMPKQKEFFVTQGDKYLNLQFFAPTEEAYAKKVILLIRDHSQQKTLDDRRRNFVADVSHELKTPLTSILSYAEALSDADVDEDTRKKFVDVIVTEANRMDRLIGDLLQLSRLSGERYPLNRRRFPFDVLIRNCVEKIKLEAENRNLTIETFIIGELPEVMMDVDKMEQVILNILSNSIKYTPEKGKITIYAGMNFNQVYAKISDTGIGIPAEGIDRVFERFYRVDKARTRKEGGTGLGLAISKEIVDAHNGTISLTSEFGEGTEVMIRLPIRSQNINDKPYDA